jgi:membrane-associated phospholipid phosphatase
LFLLGSKDWPATGSAAPFGSCGFERQKRTYNGGSRVGNVLSVVIVCVMFEILRLSAGRRSRGPNFPLTVRPTRADVAVAQSIARHTAPAPQQVARALTWGADEKVLLVLATAAWLVSRGCAEPLRRAGSHALLVTVAASLLPHGLKLLFDQTRPDRRTVIGHLNGVPFSGKRLDAFPSGHALHMGALASAAGALPTRPRRAIRAIAVGLSLTRIMVLAHWASDVVAGFALGAVLERALRFWTGYSGDREDDHADP